jgi:hypothetical protein
MKPLSLATLFIVAMSPIVAAQDVADRNSKMIRHQEVRQAYGKLPLGFEPNDGQVDGQVRFLARGSGYGLFLTATEAVLALQTPAGRDRPSERAVVRMKLASASRHVRIEGLDALPGTVNYFVGDPSRWRRSVPSYARVRYHGVYPGIDLVFYGNQGQLEYDFVVAPRANPAAIRLVFEGTSLRVDTGGDLVGAVGGGEIRMRKPLLYQDVAGVRVPIRGEWLLADAGQVGFRVAAYDRTKPLVIDPILSYATYLGGSLDDVGAGIAVDDAGNSYVTGFTTSMNFPRTGTAVQATLAGSNDAFVTKLDPTGSTLVYSTYLGGSGSEAASDIAVDSLGNAYVTGATLSPDFPTTAGAVQAFGGATDAFVTKLNSTGSALVYSTYLGGNDVDTGGGIGLDAAGNAYVAGSTLSPDFPTTPGAYQTIPRSGLPAPPTFTPSRYDAFVTKLLATGSLGYSTYLGGTDSEVGADVAVDSAGNAYLTGSTRSDDFPTTPAAFQSSRGGLDEAAYVTKLDASGSFLQYSTYLTGSHHDFGSGIAVDAAGSAYVTGGTQAADFPTTPNAAQPTFGGDADAFLTKLQPDGTALAYSTYLGSSGQEWADDVAVDSGGNAYVTGTTRSTDFPTTPGAFQPASGGGFYDIFVAKLNPVSGAVIYSSYLGGSDAEAIPAVAVDPAGSAYVTGFTVSEDFPVTPAAFQPAFGGERDAFVAKISDAVPPGSSIVGKVTGGGSIQLGNRIGTFGFAVQRKTADGPINGSLQYFNHATGSKVRAVTFTALTIAGATAFVEGTCTINGSPCTFALTVTAGDGPEGETFVIRIAGAAPEGGGLRGGNIHIHQ